MKIVFLDAATVGKDVSLSAIEEFGELKVFSVTEPAQVVERCAQADIVITNKVRITRQHIRLLPKLKLICLAATGMDNVDLAACEERGVEVKNVKGYSSDSVAQVAVTTALALQCKLFEQDRFGKNDWVHDKVFTNLDNPFTELAGKTWGIIGLGDIGSKVADIASAFGCNVIYYSSSGADRSKVYKRAQLDEVLGAHVISVHCPLTDKTRSLIDESNVGFLRDDAVFVNAARGGVVDERAMVKRFKESNLRLGFDVVDGEPIRADNPLMEIKSSSRLILTPHMAWSSLEARSRLIEGIYKNIKSFVYSSERSF